MIRRKEVSTCQSCGRTWQLEADLHSGSVAMLSLWRDKQKLGQLNADPRRHLSDHPKRWPLSRAATGGTNWPSRV